MSSEITSISIYLSLVHETESHVFLARYDQQPINVATIRLIEAIIAACTVGLPPDAILAAIHMGEALDYFHQLPKVPRDPAYWQAVREEAETFWQRRYDPNAPEDW